jgi:ketosteroid isomerase-like protein
MASGEDAIRARRRLTNKLIAAHDAARLRPFLDPQVKLITGDGSLILGVEAVLEAFEGQFQDPSFVTYLRTTESVEIDQEGARGGERGTWIATWRGAEGDTTLSGWYLAVWKKTVGQWVIESELFVSLA